MSRVHLVITILISVCFNCLGQQANNWYFGFNAGITFNTTPPTALLDGALFTTEGCANISDNNGRILFYTNGITVYNRSHQAMPNGTGLFGGSSSANAAIIVPQPGSENIFYIFTSDESERGCLRGYNYSIVDMSLNNGLGDVTEKNQLLYAPSCEGLTAFRHANGLDVWVVTKVLGSNEWRVYKIDCNGINASPVSSIAGTSPSGTLCRLKTSPDGKKIVITKAEKSQWELLDIDNSNGIVSNAVSIYQNVPFGVEFSPDSKLVYISSNNVIQYDITTSNSIAILNSGVHIYDFPPQRGVIAAMQLGPDNKIYCAVGNSYQLAVINSPNTPGVACNFNINQVDTKGRLVVGGLPAFLPNLITDKTADFSYVINSDCAKVDFAASSAISGNLTFNWDFGDGQTGTGQQVSHTYALNALNVNRVKLTIVSVYPCYVVVTKEVNLKRIIPTASFDAGYTCGDFNVHLMDKSTISGTTISDWHWEFGDGQEAHGQSPNHTYTTYGNYTITLSVTSAGICNGTDKLQKIIPIEAKPVAAFSNTPTCIGKPVQFNEASTILSGTITDWKWIFHDGISLEANPLKIYNTPGSYPVKLVAKSSTGCISDTVYKTITVSSNPLAGFTVADTCFTQSTLFQGNASVANGTISDWWWKIGENMISNSQNPTYSFSPPGMYPVQFVAKANTGCISDTFSRLISIRPKPVAGFAIQDGCVNLPLKILNNSSVDAGIVSSGIWNFGNGETKQGFIPNYAYATAGTYTIQYNAVSDAGCISDPIKKTVLIESIPAVDFSFDNTCAGKPVNFVNLSSNSFGAITHLKWTFGNGDFSTEQSPTYTYNYYGEYVVSLVNTTQNGCSASKTKTITIAKVNIDAGNDIIAAIDQPLQLKVSGGASYTWYPSTYLSDPMSPTPVATPHDNITYFITGVTAQGCIGYDTLYIKTYKGPSVYVPNGFSPNGKNRLFRPILVGISELKGFSVYNRWGQLIFSTSEMNKGWDGKWNGIDQPAGAYVWMLQAKDYIGNLHQKKGTLILVR
jgi:gliding motility-associated-like protein